MRDLWSLDRHTVAECVEPGLDSRLALGGWRAPPDRRDKLASVAVAAGPPHRRRRPAPAPPGAGAARGSMQRGTPGCIDPVNPNLLHVRGYRVGTCISEVLL